MAGRARRRSSRMTGRRFGAAGRRPARGRAGDPGARAARVDGVWRRGARLRVPSQRRLPSASRPRVRTLHHRRPHDRRPTSCLPAERSPMASPAVPASALTLHLTARGECWVSITADGREVVSRLMGVGEEEAVRAGSELRIKVGDASAVGMRLNGSPVRSLGRAGQVVTPPHRYGQRAPAWSRRTERVHVTLASHGSRSSHPAGGFLPSRRGRA